MNKANQITSKGNQEKYYDSKNKLYYKVDVKGYESISEVLTSTLLKFIKGVDFVDYFLYDYKGKGACVCKSYLRDGESEISVFDLFLKYFDKYDVYKYFNSFRLDSFDYLINGVKEITGLDITDYISTMVYIDTLVVNEDRHYNNIVFIYDGNKYKLSPYFDFGGSLMSDTVLYPIDTSYEACIDLAKSKPFSTSFEEQLTLFNRKPLEIDIKGFIKYLKMVEVNLDKSVPFKQKEYFKAKDVLLKSLKKWEGTLWKKSC